MKLKEIAERIEKYLEKFENDPNINKLSKNKKLLPYYNVNCWNGKKYVYVRYVSYQTAGKINKDEAIKYLEWLEKGNVGKYWKIID